MDLIERRQDSTQPRHPWESVRGDFFLRVLKEAGLPHVDAQVLDVGSGDGWFASRLAESARLAVACWDTGYASHPAPPDKRLTCTSTEPDGWFDLVLAMDVTEHVEDDRGFVEGLVQRRLKTGGHLLFSVPAWPVLFSEHDRFLDHVRRYTPSAGRELLIGAGLRIVRAGGLFHSLVGVRAIECVLRPITTRRAPSGGEWRGSSRMTAILKGALSADVAASLWLSRVGWNVPGLTWWALCKKP